MQTSENQQALGRILDMTRLISILLLSLHFYYQFYSVFQIWKLVSPFSDRILDNIVRTRLFEGFNKAKYFALGFLLISLLGVKGKKMEKLQIKNGLLLALGGLCLFFGSNLALHLSIRPVGLCVLYMAVTIAGYTLTLSGSTLISRVISDKLSSDIFNSENETFPQQQKRLENEFSINLPTRFQLKSKFFSGWINIINPFRGLLVLGSPGAGKSYFVIRHGITQHIAKNFTMFVYDFKYPDLTLIAYNHWLKKKDSYPTVPSFFYIDFDELSYSHRCNPLDPEAMLDITDAAESARTILMGLNREWIKKQGDFFVESPINFMTAVIWFLRKYQDGAFCTLPHVLELMQLDYDSLFSILLTEKEIDVLINPFMTAYLNDAMEQLEGQIGSAKIALARLSSPNLYYVLSGNDFKLDLNNPKEPKIICMGNNPQKIMTYGAVLSLYVNRLIKIVNQKGKLKSSLIFDEFPTLYLSNIDTLMATARSSQVATTLAIQDFSQLKKDYGREQADVIMNIAGNIISGQVTGDTAKQLSERFGKIMQDRSSLSINRSDTSVSRSKQLELAIPASKISTLSSGEFVGIVADDPTEKINLKAFHSQIQNDHKALKKEIDQYVALPKVRQVNSSIVNQNYQNIKEDVQNIYDQKMSQILSDPALSHLLVNKKKR
ncbi:conjugal transfer protein MobC [Dyadobacter subterraneus]|uniref:Type IV secretory system conjugative DNA transfer family protein n=1 Tax=Dyadobacter subterraneus TaxID=2773304 RepID=A0ABR9W9C1_9BACT|nr:conjugal transfer protein MobC [Dyadobacter subterraneus]MBE9462058.1 type IV secretory system conjugative DNA transfer family protein [Dyadobacter subterraneus]